jgi:hypothetical protein
MAMKLVPGKVYLRDTRNGNEYEYESNLASMSFIVPFTHEEPVKEDKPEATNVEASQNTTSTGLTQEPAKPAAPATPPKAPTVPNKPVAKVATKVATKVVTKTVAKPVPKPPAK